MSLHRRAAQRGFTLLELAIVLLILIAIAAAVIPSLGFMKDRADHATTANSAAQVMSYLELHRVTKGVYGNGFDSLIDETGGKYGPVFTHPGLGYTVTTIGAAFGGPPAAAGTPEWALTKLFHEIFTLHNHDPAVTDHGNSSASVASRDVYDGGEYLTVSSGSDLARYAYPGTDGDLDFNGDTSDDVLLFAFGVGPNCDACKGIMRGAPTSLRADGETYYNRFIAIFAVHLTTGRVSLRTVVDAYGKDVAYNTAQFQAATPE